MLMCYWAISDEGDPSGAQKMVKNGQKWSKMTLFTTPHGKLSKIKKIIKEVSGVIGIDLTNSNLMLLYHIWF